MAKHVYPPWHSNIQKFLFAVAVILCITLPVLYGEHDSDISSTTVIIVLVLYFCLWIAFSVWAIYVCHFYHTRECVLDAQHAILLEPLLPPLNVGILVPLCRTDKTALVTG